MVDVVINVYDLTPKNKFLFRFGLGLYHSGVEVAGREYTFGTEGVVVHVPRAVEVPFRHSIVIGTLPDRFNVAELLTELREDFRVVGAKMLCWCD